MKIINQILISNKISTLDFNSEQEFIEAVNNSSYPEVDCPDENKVEKFYKVLSTNTKIIRSKITEQTMRAVEIKKCNLEIFEKLGT